MRYRQLASKLAATSATSLFITYNEKRKQQKTPTPVACFSPIEGKVDNQIQTEYKDFCNEQRKNQISMNSNLVMALESNNQMRIHQGFGSLFESRAHSESRKDHDRKLHGYAAVFCKYASVFNAKSLGWGLKKEKNKIEKLKKTWRSRGSNPGPFTCETNALPLRYTP